MIVFEIMSAYAAPFARMVVVVGSIYLIRHYSKLPIATLAWIFCFVTCTTLLQKIIFLKNLDNI